MADQISGLFSAALRAERLRVTRPLLTGRVLDYGCGIGRLADTLPPERYFGVDADGESVDIARAAHPRHRFGSPEDMAAAAPYDTIALLAVLEYIPDRVAFFAQCRGLLAPGGRIVLTTPHPLVNLVRRSLAPLGLVSRYIDPRRDSLPDRAALQDMAGAAGLTVARYRRFLLGVNQLAVLVAT